MWISPNHPDPPQTASAPIDTARQLATFPRSDRAELRVSLARFQGRAYVNLRIWEANEAGEWWPAKGKGCSIRIHELSEMVAALRSAEGLIDDEDARQDEPPVRPYDGRSGVQYERDDGEARPRYTPRRGRPQPRSFNGEDIAAPRTSGSDFNECDQ
jgi:hypothetical protein